MNRRLAKAAAVSALAVGLVGLTTMTVPAHAATKAHHSPPASLPGIGRLLPSSPHSVLPVHGGTVDSLNWSGYAVSPGSVTAVTGSFTVPSAALLPPGFAATWTGIGGYNSSDLIQAGVGENSLFTNPLTGPQYYAWYEVLPAAETPITGCTGDPNCTVNPGDSVTVSIQNVGTNQWNITMVDAGHWSWSPAHPINYTSSESSAEWILEAPTVAIQTLLAEVGVVHFGPTSTYTSGGVTRTIGSGSYTKIVLTPGLINEATPSNLSTDGESFNDCAYAQTCPTP